MAWIHIIMRSDSSNWKYQFKIERKHFALNRKIIWDEGGLTAQFLDTSSAQCKAWETEFALKFGYIKERKWCSWSELWRTRETSISNFNVTCLIGQATSFQYIDVIIRVKRDRPAPVWRANPAVLSCITYSITSGKWNEQTVLCKITSTHFERIERRHGGIQRDRLRSKTGDFARGTGEGSRQCKRWK